ncbi:hypothetical protein RBSWK_06405 [Rhodopirellula baltica SWK14]|uniref:Uncharacterized protein n=1 Tax=Rhodopirellula baltica SWK14 TaxID=993516 RepID=L7C689_RHOBT|nr:hypothetical protein RBSWK_06405 [Rhodopirellula baltica SWK14]
MRKNFHAQTTPQTSIHDPRQNPQPLPDLPPSDPEERTRLAKYDPMLGWKIYEPVID